MVKKYSKNPIDICFLDFDNCLYPGISKVHAFIYLTLKVIVDPKKKSDWFYLPYIGFSGLQLLALRLRQRGIGDITDGQLVQKYRKFFSPIPRHYFNKAADIISRRIPPGAFDTIVFLSCICPVGIISLAITELLESVNEMLKNEYSTSLAFIHGNSLDVFETRNLVLTAEDKRLLMQKEIEYHNCKSPLVIGNDEEDLGMVTLAKEMDGISVGLKPKSHIAHHFDFSIEPNDWYVVLSFLEELLASRGFRNNQ